MAKPWSEVAASQAYQQLPADEQQVARRQYFDQVVAPKVPQAERGAAWAQFSTWEPQAAGSRDTRAVPRAGAPAQDVGLAKGLAREATQGLTFEFGDEIGLGAAALAAKAAQKLGAAPDTGQSTGDIYRDMRGHYDAERQQFAQDHQVAATAANIAGSLATGGAGGAKVLTRVARAATPVRVATTAAVGGAQGALYGAGAADPGERMEGAARGAAIGAVVAPAASEAIGGGVKTLARQRTKSAVDVLTPARDDVAGAARQLYERADGLKVVLKPQTVGRLQSELSTRAKQEGFNARIHPKVAAALDSFDDLATDVPTLGRLEQQRRILGAAAKSLEPDERRLASELIDHYDDVIQGLKAVDVTAGNVVQAGALLRQARGLWQRQAKLGVIEDAVERAQNQASGFENGLRTQFRAILNSPKKSRGFSPAEKAAMQHIVRGGAGENTLRLLGRFGWGEKGATNVVGAAIGAGAGAAASGGVGAVAVPVMGQIARRAAARATAKNVEQLQRLVAAGAHPRFIVNRYAQLAGPRATPQELAQYLVTAPQQDLLALAGKLNTLKGPQRKLATDAIALTIAANAGAAAGSATP
ncbi:MAG: hypothetical protein AB1651_16505 [Pseudomonadota bacterium]